MRILELLPFAMAAVARWVRGAPRRLTTFDESRAFEALRLNGDAAIITATVVFGVILIVALRQQARGSAIALIVGGLTGWTIWRMLLH
jgi:hypothetical protein